MRTANNVSLKIKFILQQVCKQSFVLARPCTLEFIVRAHHRGYVSSDCLGKGPEIELDVVSGGFFSLSKG